MLMGALFLAGCSSVESVILYQPTPGAPKYEAPPLPIQDLELAMPDGTKIHARWAPHPKATGAVLYCHGNGGNVEQWGGAVREIWENLGEYVISKVVRPFSRSRVSAVFAELTMDQIKQHRSKVEEIVKDDLNHHFKDRGLDCEGFLLSTVKKPSGVPVVVACADHRGRHPVHRAVPDLDRVRRDRQSPSQAPGLISAAATPFAGAPAPPPALMPPTSTAPMSSPRTTSPSR
jgi:hypothetical protein